MQMESDFLIKWCWQRRLQFRPQMPTILWKSIPIATLSYSNYPPPHNNQLWVRGKTADHLIIFPVQWIRSLGKVQQLYLVSAPQGPGTQLGRLSTGGDSSWGQIQRKKYTPSLTPVIWDPSRGCWPEHPYTASPNNPCASGFQRQVSQDSPSTSSSVGRSGEPLPQK